MSRPLGIITKAEVDAFQALTKMKIFEPYDAVSLKQLSDGSGNFIGKGETCSIQMMPNGEIYLFKKGTDTIWSSKPVNGVDYRVSDPRLLGAGRP